MPLASYEDIKILKHVGDYWRIGWFERLKIDQSG